MFYFVSLSHTDFFVLSCFCLVCDPLQVPTSELRIMISWVIKDLLGLLIEEREEE